MRFSINFDLQDTPRNMRFSINFFTSIGLGGLTDNMREHLKNIPRLIAQPAAGSDSDASSSSSSGVCPLLNVQEALLHNGRRLNAAGQWLLPCKAILIIWSLFRAV